MRHETTIQGIPGQVEVVHYPAERGSRERGTGLQLEPDYPAYWEIEGVYDRRGRYAEWLEKKMTKEDVERILGEVRDYD